MRLIVLVTNAVSNELFSLLIYLMLDKRLKYYIVFKILLYQPLKNWTIFKEQFKLFGLFGLQR